MRKLSTIPEYALNAICPYYAMFPLEFPMQILKRVPRSSVVFDPFCGRGTTNYAAQVLGMKSYGVDASPVAVAIAQAKFATADVADVAKLARHLVSTTQPTSVPTGKFWTAAFHPSTLEHVCALREGLIGRRLNDRIALLRALALGCLHGPTNKTPATLSYFSNQMPRTFASKPASALRYWKKNKMRPPKVDVVSAITRKAMRSLANPIETSNSPRNIRRGDSSTSKALNHIDQDVNVVVTSPPYYGLQTYVEDQWLRNWFLGGPDHVPYGSETGLRQTSPEDFAIALSEVWYQVSCVASESVKMVIRFGSIASREVDAREILRESLRISGAGWRSYRTIPLEEAPAGKRQAAVMGTKSRPLDEYDFHCRLG